MIKKTFALLFSFIAVISVFSVVSFAWSEENCVYDYGNLFSEEDVKAINDAAKKNFGDTNCSVYIVSAPEGSKYWGDDFRKDNPSTDKNAVILIFSNKGYNYDIYTYGKCNRLISDGEVEDILDCADVYDSVKLYGDCKKAAITFIEMSADACKPKIGLAILIGCIFGLTAAGTVAICIIVSYKQKSRSEKYPLERYAKLELNNSQDLFAGSFITKRRINNSSGSGRSGGGSSFGGGSGHRGGR